MFRITGRYKELIIGAGGENIAPVPIEDEVKRRCKAISNFVMIGDKRKFNVALVTLKAKGATGVTPGGNELDAEAAAVDPELKTIEQAAAEGSAIVKVRSERRAASEQRVWLCSTAALLPLMCCLGGVGDVLASAAVGASASAGAGAGSGAGAHSVWRRCI
jgi:long-subunit acyl-CoA synthetase (AMP-forming)